MPNRAGTVAGKLYIVAGYLLAEYRAASLEGALKTEIKLEHVIQAKRPSFKVSNLGTNLGNLRGT